MKSTAFSCCVLSHLPLYLSYDKFIQFIEELTAVIAVDLELQLLGKIQAEDTHDRLCVDCVASAYDIGIVRAACDDAHEILNVVYLGELDFCGCHSLFVLSVRARAYATVLEEPVPVAMIIQGLTPSISKLTSYSSSKLLSIASSVIKSSLFSIVKYPFQLFAWIVFCSLSVFVSLSVCVCLFSLR